MKSKLLSTCCKAPAKVDMSRDDFGMFCTECGVACSTRAERTGFGSKPSTLSTVRKPTGELELFRDLWAKVGGKSEVNGEVLPKPGEPLFHYCGSHLLPKGTYPDYRLDPRNVVMMTPDQHEHWHRTPKGILLADPQWAPIVARYMALKKEAERKHELTR